MMDADAHSHKLDSGPGVTLYDSLTAEEKQPIAEPNLIDVQSIRSKFANLLLKQQSEEEETGHANIVKTAEGHRCWVLLSLCYPHQQ